MTNFQTALINGRGFKDKNGAFLPTVAKVGNDFYTFSIAPKDAKRGLFQQVMVSRLAIKNNKPTDFAEIERDQEIMVYGYCFDNKQGIARSYKF